MKKPIAPNPFELAARIAKFRTFPATAIRDLTIANMEIALAALRLTSFTALCAKEALAAGHATGASWWEACQLMYPLFSITDAEKPEENGLYFRSEAADWQNPEEHVYGPFPSDFERLFKILQLITYKENDRKYGVGSVEKDFARVQELMQQERAAA